MLLTFSFSLQLRQDVGVHIVESDQRSVNAQSFPSEHTSILPELLSQNLAGLTSTPSIGKCGTKEPNVM